MAHVEATALVDRNIDELWREIGPFHAMAEWHPMLARVEGSGDEIGALRAAETRDNQHQVERLIALNPEDHRYRYEIMSTDMPVDHYVGDFSARPESGQHSTVIWSADFEVTAGDETEVASVVRRFLAAGVENPARRYV